MGNVTASNLAELVGMVEEYFGPYLWPRANGYQVTITCVRC